MVLARYLLIRQSIELGLKALYVEYITRIKIFRIHLKNVVTMYQSYFKKYIVIGEENYLTNKEREWLINYLLSLEDVDSKSDMFRFL